MKAARLRLLFALTEVLRVRKEAAAKRRAALDQILELVSYQMEKEAELAHAENEKQGRRWVANENATTPKASARKTKSVAKMAQPASAIASKAPSKKNTS